ncbi:Ppx/GppA phosphatase family-domain-containing protein [Kalaharituber pfeilii]|nr:Ppx/GppA phosphatase family-domain-containing protein [Kalaharituber pfeilii]
MPEVSLNEYYRALVDIGSNGVRFSITNLHPASARIMPTVFQDRAPISLYDAQFSGTTKSPISGTVIAQLVTCMLRFKSVCTDFGVPSSNVRVVATEATREAQNSAQFRAAIESATGWKVELLSKEDEGRIGAEGIASSFAEVRGLVMDLGGGSTQITWMISENGNTRMAEKAVSFPYGAAAVTKKLETAIDGKARMNLHNQMVESFSAAFASLKVPDELNDVDIDHPVGPDAPPRPPTYKLYLSGGGFRGFGYLLMDKHDLQPYPIPIINGFTAPARQFHKVAVIHKDVEQVAALQEELESAFGISARRARQVPAVAFVVEALMEAVKGIHTVVFCQGGVREGAVYESLPKEIRAEDPLVVATRPYAPPSVSKLLMLLNNALPRSTPYHIRKDLLPALANLLTYHSNVPKESQASVALYTTTAGCLANAHGLSHGLRALLGIALCERWGGQVHAAGVELKAKFMKLVGVEDGFWAKYVGLVAYLIGIVYPAGIVRGGEGEEKIKFFALDDGKRKEGKKRHGKAGGGNAVGRGPEMRWVGKGVK